MSDKKDRQIGEELRRITGTGRGERFPVMSGVVTEVNAENNECTVQLTADATDTPTDGILLNVVTANVSGVYMVPAVNANCIVAEVDGPGKWELIRADNYTKIVIQASTLIQLNDGSLGGMAKAPELQSQVNKLNSIVNAIVNVLTGAVIDEPGNGSPSALQAALKTAVATLPAADFSNIINNNITQG